MSVDGALRYLGMRGRGGMQRSKIKREEIEEIEEVPLPTYVGETQVAHVYCAPQGKVITGYQQKLNKSKMNKSVAIDITTFERGETINFTTLAEAGYQLQEDLTTVQSDDTDRLLITIAIPENDPVELCVEGSIKIFLEDDTSASNPLASLPRRSSTSTTSSGYPKAKSIMQRRPSQGSSSSPFSSVSPKASAKATTLSPSSPATSGSPAKGNIRPSVAKAQQNYVRQSTNTSTPATKAKAKSKAEGNPPKVAALTPITEGASAAEPAATKTAAPTRLSRKGTQPTKAKAAAPKQAPEPLHDLLTTDVAAYKGETILDKEAIAKLLAGDMPLAATKNKIIPYFGKDKPEKDNGCRFLSNFYDKEGMTNITLTFEGQTYTFSSVEIQYQCRKSLLSPSEDGKTANKEEMIQAFAASTAKESKKLANQKYFSFDARNLAQMDEIMFEGLLQKFPNDPANPMTQKLLRTGNAILIEGNDWGDTTWGMVYDAANQTFEGENKLGKMLMLIRYARSQGQTDSDIDRMAWKQQAMKHLLAGKLFKAAAKPPKVTLPLEAKDGLPYKLMTPSSREVAWVQAMYERTAKEKDPQDPKDNGEFTISKVEKIRSRDMNQAYASRMRLLDRRQGNPIFDPKWKAAALDQAIAKCVKDIAAKQQALAQEGNTSEDKAKLEKEIKKLEKQKTALEKKLADAPLREVVHSRLMDLVTESGLTEDLSGAKEVWMWHGTSKAAADGVMTSGFASLASRDEGFYGKGLYFSSDLGSIQQGISQKYCY